MQKSLVPSEPKVKGVAFRTVAICFRELKGDDAFEQARDVMMPELADAFRYGTLLAASWYPIGWYRELFRSLRESSSSGIELPHSIGMLAAQHDMAGVHKRIVAKLLSPQALFNASQRVFNTYYDTGKAQTLEHSKGYVRARFSGCIGWDANMWAELLGSCQSLLEIAGARDVGAQIVSGGGDSDTMSEFEAHWE